MKKTKKAKQSMKQRKPKQRRSPKSTGPGINSYVTPKTQARYWATKIGVLRAIVSGKGASAIARVEFLYERSGSRLSTSEYMDFPISRLIEVADFASRVGLRKVTKSTAKAEFPEPDYEEVIAISINVQPGDALLARFRYHVTGAIERGEGEAIIGVPPRVEDDRRLSNPVLTDAVVIETKSSEVGSTKQ